MAIFDWSGMIGAGIGAAGGVFSTILQNRSNRELNSANIKYQKETNAQNEQLQREQWAREDSAVQRRAADLEKAGLSKNLAAGSAASSSLSTTMQAPQNKFANDYGKLAASFNLYNQYLQNQYLREQIGTQKATTANVNADTAQKEKITGWTDLINTNQVALSQARTQLYNVESQVKASQASAELDLIVARTQDILQNSAQARELFTFTKRKAQNEVSNIYSQTQLNYARINEVSQSIAESVARENYLNQEAKKVVFDTAYQSILNSINAYNFQFSVDNGIRTTDNSSVTPIGLSESAKDRAELAANRRSTRGNVVISGVSSLISHVLGGAGAALALGGANHVLRKYVGNDSPIGFRLR